MINPTFVEKVSSILTNVKYLDWTFFVGMDDNRVYLQVQFDGIDTFTDTKEVQHGRKWLLSPHMTKNEIVQTAFKAVLTAMEHEVRESFFYRDKRIFGPHFDVDALWEIADRIDVR